ncbi:amino acid adenylation domain-containing protein [Streptomyces sp. NPDC050528]|uniref:amino acid adenylation domain-containing protein n=1 Tax=Streptomyces sp. NPDC050528 TaxID=3365623 RepID=UPI0037A1CD45
MLGAQLGVWYGTLLEPHSPRFNMSQTCEVLGPVDPDILRATFRHVSLEVEAVRLRCVEEEGVPAQRVGSLPPPPMEFVDFSDAPDPRESADAWIEADRVKVFDLAVGSMTRHCLLKLAHDRFIVSSCASHIALDGYGETLFNQRTTEVYQALLDGKRPEVRSLGSVRELVDEESAYRGSAEYDEDRRYWTERLDGAGTPPSLSLGPRQGEEHQVVCSGRIPSEQRDALRTATRAALPVVIAAAVAVYLNRVTGESDIVLGIPVSERVTPAAKKTPSMMTNSVPLRLTVDRDMSFAEVVKQVLKEMRDGRRHQRYRFQDLRRDLRLRGDQKLFGPEINVLTFPNGFELGGHKLIQRYINTGPCDDLTLLIYDPADGHGLVMDAIGNSDRYSEDEVTGHHRRLRHILDLVTENPDIVVGDIDVLYPAEREKILVEWNDTAVPVPDTTLAGMFAAQVAATPDAAAAVHGDETVSYAVLDATAGGIARVLADHGAGPGQCVALLLPRSVGLVAAMVAVAKTGAAFLPVDTEFPDAHVGRILSDAGPGLVITDAAHASVLPPDTRHVVVDSLGAVGEVKAGAREAACADTAVGETPAYVIYTSGSTGQPKGVVVPQRGIVNRLHWTQAQYALESGDRVLHKTSISFDVALWEIWWPLTVGAAVVIAEPGGQRDPAYLSELIRRTGVTTAHFVPSLLAEFLNEPSAASCWGLLRVLSSGERLSGALAERFHRTLPTVRLHNLYGPTEASIDVTAWESRPEEVEGTDVPIGRPVFNTRTYVLNDSRMPVPPGYPGDLYLAGAQLASGYLNRPDLTAEQFVADPYGTSPDERMYRTGDIARYRPDGVLEYLGRADGQVKIHGFRIELGAVEAVLLAHDDVRAAVATVHTDRAGHERLIAHVVRSDPESSLTDADLREFVASRLPSYMAPTVLTVDAIPLKVNGKVDHSALPAPDFSSRGPKRVPRTAVEHALHGLVASVLGLDDIGIDDNFFERGGDSILAIRLVTRAREQGWALSVQDVFSEGTVRTLAAVARHVSQHRADEAPGLGWGEVAVTPIVAMLEQTADSFDAFHQFAVLRTPLGLGQDTVKNALQAVLDHHDMLRLRAWREDGRLRQVVSEPGSVRVDGCLTRVSVGELDGKAWDDVLTEQRHAQAGRLRPEDGTVFKAVWFDAGPERRGRLLLVLHHLVVDAVSWRVILADLAQACASVDAGLPVELARVHGSFRQWAIRETTDAALAAERSLATWEHQLRRPNGLFGDHAGDDVPNETVAALRNLTIDLPPETTAPLLTSIPAAFHATTEDVLLTALALAIGRLRALRRPHNPVAADDSVLLMLERHGRTTTSNDAGAPDISGTVGWFTHEFPVSLQLGTLDWSEVVDAAAGLTAEVKRTKERLRTVRGISADYGRLRHLNSGTATALSDFPQPQVLFNYLGRTPADQDADWAVVPTSEGLVPGYDPHMPVRHGLEINVCAYDLPEGPRLTANWLWSPGQLDESEVRLLADLWETAVRGIVGHMSHPGTGGRTPTDLPLVALSQTEIEVLEEAHPSLEDVFPPSPDQTAGFKGTEPLPRPVQWVVHLAGPLEPERLRTAIASLTRRHGALRGGMWGRGENGFVHFVVADASPAWRFTDLSALGPIDRDTQILKVREEDWQQPFDLARPPLFRFTLVRLGQAEHRLVMTNDHRVLDGWSFPVLLEELLELYETDGNDEFLAPVPSYRSYVEWLTAQDEEAARNAWATALAHAHPTVLARPLVGARAPLEEITLELPLELTTALAEIAGRHRMTLGTVFQGAWAAVLGRLTGESDLVLLSSTGGRPPEIAGVERMVGALANSTLLRIRLDGDKPFIDELKRLRDQQADLLAHRHLPLRDVLEISGMERLPDVMFLNQNYPLDREKFSDRPVIRVSGIDFRSMGEGVSLNPMIYPGSPYTMVVRYQPKQLREAEVREMCEQFTDVLSSVAAAPGLPLAAHRPPPHH